MNISRLALLFAATLPLLACSRPPADDRLVAEYSRRQEALEKIARLVQADPSLVRCSGNMAIEQARQRFQVASHQAQVDLVCSDDPNEPLLLSVYQSKTSAMNLTLKGFAYSRTTPAPIVAGLDNWSPAQREDLAFRRVGRDWYLFQFAR